MVRRKKDNKPSAEELAKQAEERAIYRLPSTYSLVTAERLLIKLGISAEQSVVSSQIQHPEAYYHALLYLPAKRLGIAAQTERCRDIQAYGQQKLIHYLFSGEASKGEEEAGHTIREGIELDRQTMVNMGQDFSTWEEGSTARNQQVYDELQERAVAWHRTISEVVKQLMVCLQNESIKGTTKLKQQFIEQLLESSTRLKLTEAQMSKYRCPETVGVVEKTVICLVEKTTEAEKLSKASLKKMRPTFMELDKKMQTDFDTLTGFNKEGSQQVKLDEQFLEDMTKRFENHIVNFSKKLFSYFKEYASDSSLRVDVEAALEQGVDEAVADDYRALHLGQ